MTTRFLALFVSLALLFVGAPAAVRGQEGAPPEGAPQEGAQEDEPIQLGGSLVTVPFNASDKKNKHIIDVKQPEVQVFEDGKPQEIFSFERMTEAALTISLLVDTSGSMEATIGEERVAAHRFFQKVLRPEKDLASVITFSKAVTLEQPLTANIEMLNRGLERARVSPSAAYGGIGTPPANPGAGGTSMYDAVYLAAGDVLRAEAGRRVIILLTDGVDTTSSYKINEAIERAWRSEVIIYAIGIGDFRYGGVDRGALDRLTKETGGRFFEPRKDIDLDRAFDEIENDLRQQYVLTYTPANAVADGTFRKIEVKLAGETRKDVRVRHRRGYYAPNAVAKK
jgi:Ca-activated chloride channel family protein